MAIQHLNQKIVPCAIQKSLELFILCHIALLVDNRVVKTTHEKQSFEEPELMTVNFLII